MHTGRHGHVSTHTDDPPPHASPVHEAAQPTPCILAGFGFLTVFIKDSGARGDASGAAGGTTSLINLCSTAKLSQRLKFPQCPLFSSKSARTVLSTTQPNLARQVLSKSTASLSLHFICLLMKDGKN